MLHDRALCAVARDGIAESSSREGQADESTVRIDAMSGAALPKPRGAPETARRLTPPPATSVPTNESPCKPRPRGPICGFSTRSMPTNHARAGTVKARS